MPTFVRNAILIAVPVAIAAVVGAVTYMVVSGDDAPDLGDIRVEPGRVSCEMFEIARGYRYDALVVLDLADRPPEMEATDPYRAEGFTFTTDVSALVEGTNAIHAFMELPENNQTQEFVIIGEDTYQSASGAPFEKVDAYEIPYVPGASCNAIAPDIFLSDKPGTPEAVGGVEATRYHFDELNTDFPDRHPSFGASSDAAVYVNTFSGDIWVAEEGGYIIKMDLVGVGHYENGRELTVTYAYELFDVNAKIKVEPPI